MAMTEEQLTAKIAELDEIIDAGVTSTTVDGITTSIDLNTIKSQRKYYARQLTKLEGGSGSRFKQINLSGEA